MSGRETANTALTCECGNEGRLIHTEWANPVHHGGLGQQFESLEGSFSKNGRAINCDTCGATVTTIG